jgi:hypothetical protein
MIKLYARNISYYTGIYLEGRRKSTEISVRVFGVLIEIGTENLLNTSHSVTSSAMLPYLR